MQGNFPFDQFFKTDSSNQNNINNLVADVNSTKENLVTENQTLTSSFFSEEELDMMNIEIHNSLKSLIAPQKYSAYFEGSFNLKNIEDNKAVFATTTQFIKTMIEKYLPQISDSIINTLGKSYQIEIITDSNNINNLDSSPVQQVKPTRAAEVTFSLDLEPKKDELLSKVESKYIDHMEAEYSGILIDPGKRFTNFVVGPSNNLANAAAIAISKNPGKSGKYPSLYMHSNSGLGKTHLLHAMANGIKDNYPQYVICLITARDFMKEMIDSIREERLHEFRKKYSEKVDVLMIDDIHELGGKEGTQREIFHIFNELYNRGKQLIFTSDKTPQEINGLEDRIRTRLQWGLVVDIQRPDFETRLAIIKTKADELDLYLTDDIINLIACNIKTSIRELEGALIKLSAFTDIMNVNIDVEMVKDVLALKEHEEERKITLDGVAKTTSQHFKIPIADLKSKSRTKDIANARFIAMYLSRKIVNATHEEIGRFYGNRDHSSVVHAEQKITSRLATDSSLSKDIMTIENSL
jgi:chromosomal replication initiator protein